MPTWTGTVLGALLGAIGIVSGAYFTGFLTTSRELDRNVIEFRQKAYSDFAAAQSQLESGKEFNANEKIRDAKTRILLFAPRGVICAMATYWGKYPGPKPPSGSEKKPMQPCGADSDRMRLDVAIYQQMRNDFFTALNLKRPELGPVILVPYLRACLLSTGEDLEHACQKP